MLVHDAVWTRDIGRYVEQGGERGRRTGLDRRENLSRRLLSLAQHVSYSGESLLAFLPCYLGWNPSLEIAHFDWSSQRPGGEGRGQQSEGSGCKRFNPCMPVFVF